MISLLVGYISWAQASVGSDGNRVSQPGAGICTTATIVMVLAVLIAPKTGTGDRQICLTDRYKCLVFIDYFNGTFGGKSDFRPAWNPPQDRQ
jgi:hypothetical protein